MPHVDNISQDEVPVCCSSSSSIQQKLEVAEEKTTNLKPRASLSLEHSCPCLKTRGKERKAACLGNNPAKILKLMLCLARCEREERVQVLSWSETLLPMLFLSV